MQRNCPRQERLQRPHNPSAGQVQRHTLVYFGRLEPRKGVLLFLDAVEHLRPAPEDVLFLGSDVSLGDGSSAAAMVRKRLQAQGIPCRFRHDCNREQALALLVQMQAVVCVPSLIENSPCVVEELLGSGLRLVATAVGGVAELVAPEDQHWLSAPEPEALAGHLQTALAADTPGAYNLSAAQPEWTLPLSWQALHERLPRRPLP